MIWKRAREDRRPHVELVVATELETHFSLQFSCLQSTVTKQMPVNLFPTLMKEGVAPLTG